MIGSNIANLGLIVGVSAALSPLAVDRRLLTRDVPIMIGSMLLLWAFLADGMLGTFEGSLLAAGIVLYTMWGVMSSRRETRAAREAADELPVAVEDALAAPGWKVALNGVYVVAGLALLIVGAGWLVDGAVAIAQTLGVSEAVIGLTLVAIGTSLPELATTIVATIRGHGEIALGGAIGSNVFNVLGVLGPAAIARPICVRGHRVARARHHAGHGAADHVLPLHGQTHEALGGRRAAGGVRGLSLVDRRVASRLWRQRLLRKPSGTRIGAQARQRRMRCEDPRGSAPMAASRPFLRLPPLFPS